MDPFETIGRAQATKLVDEDGEEVEFELAPGLPPADIQRLADARRAAFRLPTRDR
jgi:hypothetical protein